MIEIITIASEVLSGKVVNTNLSFISKTLAAYGYKVLEQMTIPDKKLCIEQALSQALDRADIVITTGGLGPTLDDITKQTLAEYFNKKLSLNKEIKNHLLATYGPALSSLEQQATVPEATQLLKNKLGTAPGFIFTQGKKRVYVLPGVPSEMEAMLINEAIPDILREFPLTHQCFKKTYCLCHLPENALDPFLRELSQKSPLMDIGIYPGYGVVSLELYSKETVDAHVLAWLEHTIQMQFGSYIFSTKHPSLTLALQHYLAPRGKTLFLAESCTGGKIAAHIVAHPGSSNYFLGSCVAYSNQMKTKLLQVPEDLIKRYGAVSEQVVAAMLEGALEISDADYVLAVSGIAGPDGGTVEKPVGTVVCGLKDKKGPMFVWRIQAKARGKRENVIEYTAQYILGALWRYIVYHINPS